MKTVTLVCGLPNAGKTTFCEKYDNVIHLDQVDVPSYEERLKRCIKQAIDYEGDVFVDGNFFSRQARVSLATALKKRGWKGICIWMNTPLETCLERADSGGRSRAVVNHFHKCFEEPTLDEGWDELIILNGDEDRTAI